MLVLARKEGQHVVIGERIVVTVVRARGNQIRLGIEAPQDVSIRRSELEPAADRGDDTWRTTASCVAR